MDITDRITQIIAFITVFFAIGLVEHEISKEFDSVTDDHINQEQRITELEDKLDEHTNCFRNRCIVVPIPNNTNTFHTVVPGR